METKNTIIEYLNLDKVDYDYIIERGTISNSKVAVIDHNQQVKIAKEQNKKNKQIKQSKDGKDKDKSKSGSKSTGNKQVIKGKGGKVDPKLIKAQQVLYTNSKNIAKQLNKEIKEFKDNKEQKEIKSNVIVDKNKEFNIIKQTNPSETESNKSNTTKKNKQKGQNKDFMVSSKDDNKLDESKVSQETSNANSKTVSQAKKVEDVLASIKNKKINKTKESQEIAVTSIKHIFVNKHKYAFLIDPSQKLRLKGKYHIIILLFYHQLINF